MKISNKILCFLGLHTWYYGCFQTGERSDWTGDHIGVSGRSCVDCDQDQIKYGKKYINVKSFDNKDVEAYIM